MKTANLPNPIADTIKYWGFWIAAGPLLAGFYWLAGWAYFQLIAPPSTMVAYGQYEGEPGAWPARTIIRLSEQPDEARGRVSWHHSKSKIGVDLLWIAWNEALKCDTNRDGTFTQLTSRPAANRVYDYKARDWRLTGPWSVETTEAITREHVQQAGGYLPCCMVSTIKFSPWPGVTRQITLNAQCNAGNTFWFEE